MIIKRKIGIIMALVLILTFGCSSTDQSTQSNDYELLQELLNTYKEQEGNIVDAKNKDENSSVIETDSTDQNSEQEVIEDKIDYSAIIQKANAYMENNDYSSAYKELIRAATKYPNQNDIEMALSQCEQKYIRHALQRAESEFRENKDYDAAISILMLAQIDLPNSEELFEAKEYYSSYRPIELKELTPLYEENYPLQYEDRKISDNCGNEYNGYYCPSHVIGDGRSGKTVYLVKGEYDSLKGVAFICASGKNYNNGFIEIYGDGKKLFETPELTVGTLPISFEVSISGVAQLEFRYTGGDSHDWTLEVPIMANIWLQKDMTS